MNAMYFAIDTHFIWKVHMQNEKEKKSDLDITLWSGLCDEESYLNKLDNNE